LLTSWYFTKTANII